ncbi:hypothetical protein DL95DRAFT_404752 [Leptodontidium sp. 2 PMI_412]|nr:hypothetical protein DL95DRAFT_404752 [Leptodontidium sp. 2 PMI_412]
MILLSHSTFAPVESPDSGSGVTVLVELALPELEVVVADELPVAEPFLPPVTAAVSVLNRILTPYAFKPPASAVFDTTVVPSVTFVTANVPSKLPRPPVTTHTSEEYSGGSQLAYETGGNDAHVYPDGQRVASVSISVPAEEVTQHSCEYPVGQTPGEKYCDVAPQPEERHVVVSGGPSWR